MYTKGPWTVEKWIDNSWNILAPNPDAGKPGVCYSGEHFSVVQEMDCLDDANLIVAAVNACAKVNSDNPMAVAESISDMYEALKELVESRDFDLLDRGVGASMPESKRWLAARRALVKAEGRA